MPRRLLVALGAAAALALAAAGTALGQTETTPVAVPSPAEPAPLEHVTFEEAVRRAIERHPTAGQAAQAILRAEALLSQASSVFRPAITGAVGTTILDDARGFDGNVTQPRTQSAFGATISYPILAPARWAAKNQAADQVGISRISAEEVRRQVATTAAESYLAVIAARRQLEIAVRNRDTAVALEEFARVRLDAGQGSRLNHVRSSQEMATSEARLQAAALAVRQTQEALGVAIFAGGPVDAADEPELAPATPSSDNEAWLFQRPDVRLFTAEMQAADRVLRDSWKDWLPTGTAAFAPLYVTPAGFFEPAKTWRAVFQLQLPLYDGTLGPAKKIRRADLETAKLRLDAVKDQAQSELRFTREAVTRNEGIVAANRRAAESAAEALRITEIAYRAGATTNIEVIQAQQTARNAEVDAALAEDQLLQTRLDLLVALGQFPR